LKTGDVTRDPLTPLPENIGKTIIRLELVELKNQTRPQDHIVSGVSASGRRRPCDVSRFVKIISERVSNPDIPTTSATHHPYFFTNRIPK